MNAWRRNSRPSRLVLAPLQAAPTPAHGGAIAPGIGASHGVGGSRRRRRRPLFFDRVAVSGLGPAFTSALRRRPQARACRRPHAQGQLACRWGLDCGLWQEEKPHLPRGIDGPQLGDVGAESPEPGEEPAGQDVARVPTAPLQGHRSVQDGSWNQGWRDLQDEEKTKRDCRGGDALN